MEPITLDELPAWTPWPARLLGMPERTTRGGARVTLRPSRVSRSRRRARGEFREKYGPLLAAYRENPELTLSDLKRLEIGDFQRPTAMCMGEHLFGTVLGEAISRSEKVFSEMATAVIQKHDVRSVVDLGCGYGSLLFRFIASLPDVQLLGGDLSLEAVVLGEELFGDTISLYPFDFYDCNYEVLERADAPVAVLTSYALHQLPSARNVVRVLDQYREKIAMVMCLEPEEDHFGDGLLGLLRRRYGQVNGYSADLLRVLGARDDVEVTSIPNVVGANALLPGTFSVWRFR